MSFNIKDVYNARILMVDDEENNIAVAERLLRHAGYSSIHGTTDSRMAMALYDQISPDIVFLDLHMPEPNGFELLEQLSKRRPETGMYVPVLVLTADITPGTKLKALALGASDFITKPFERCDLLLRTRNLLETRFLYRELNSASELLNDMTLVASEARETSRLLVERLAKNGDYEELESVGR